LVDKARNEVMRGMLGSQAQWVLMIDADMLWEPDAVLKLLVAAYGTHPQYDVLGAYCTLRGPLSLPTIDTGTGTWESHYPGVGVVQVMRTGAAFMLIKRHVAEKGPAPWFALRVPQRPVDAVAEVDNFCRTIFDGRNPFRGLPSQHWESLEQAAASHDSARGAWVAAEVGEDSSFCDRVTAAGLTIGVHTDIVTRHLDKEMKDWTHHRKAMDEREKQDRLLSGFTA
jgi:glycosyltransferase involved in cell wall biosynthesis